MKFYFTLYKNGSKTDLAYKMKDIDSNSLGAAIEQFGKAHNLVFFNVQTVNNVKHVFYKSLTDGKLVEYEVNIII